MLWSWGAIGTCQTLDSANFDSIFPLLDFPAVLCTSSTPANKIRYLNRNKLPNVSKHLATDGKRINRLLQIKVWKTKTFTVSPFTVDVFWPKPSHFAGAPVTVSSDCQQNGHSSQANPLLLWFHCCGSVLLLWEEPVSGWREHKPLCP